MVDLRVVVTAGGTEEPIDPVRVITNRSSGKMGFAFAEAASSRGASVTLISSRGDGGIDQARFVPMSSVESLRGALVRECRSGDLLVMAAAVSDFRVAAVSEKKLKKTADRLVLELVPVPSFMGEVSDGVFKVGFAAETHEVIEKAMQKFDKYGYDLVCANDVLQAGSGFGTDTNQITILHRSGEAVALPMLSKLEAAHRVLDVVRPRWPSSSVAGREPAC